MLIPALAAILASSTPPICPASIVTNQSMDTPAGYKVVVGKQRNFLAGVTIFVDRPETYSSIKMEKSAEVKGKVVDTYVLRLPKEVWIDCHYTATNVSLRRQLPSSTRECTVFHAQGRAKIETLTCK